MNAAFLDGLRLSLPPLERTVEPAAQLREYCQYYGIDFEARLPGVSHRVGTIRSGAFTLAVHRWEQLGANRNLRSGRRALPDRPHNAQAGRGVRERTTRVSRLSPYPTTEVWTNSTAHRVVS